MNQSIPPTVTITPLYSDLIKIRTQAPLIHNVTNLVVMPTTANLLLALGASPLMAHAPEELAAITAIARALVINIGTLDNNWIASMLQAQTLAAAKTIPIVFDPVGAGATPYRTETALTMLTRGVTIVRGNASEILALTDKRLSTKGLEAHHLTEEASQAAKTLATQYDCTVVVSGAIDLIVDQQQQVSLAYGTPLFTKVTGMGCSLTAIIAAFAAINPHPFLAAQHAVILFTLAGELAAQRSQGPGSFQVALSDVLFAITEAELTALLTRRNALKTAVTYGT